MTVYTENEPIIPRKRFITLSPTTLYLLGIIALSVFLHFSQLDNIGDGNLYYTAAVKSMLQSGHNFFFVAAEPGASVTVDKPPVGLWVQAVSAYFLGVNGLAVVLPNILAGIFSVPLIYHIVRKRYTPNAGLVAALVIASTPISIAAQRNNTSDGLLTFFLILAAWAFLNATETNQRRYLWLGATLVGIGFNIKMLQAFLPLPAFYALYFLGSHIAWKQKLMNLVGTTILLLVVSLSWSITVDLVPADQRPYIGSSTNNTVIELIIGHNGLNRLFGMNSPNSYPSPSNRQTNPPPIEDGLGSLEEVGEVGLLRFLKAPLSKEMSWLLPFAFLMMGVMFFQCPMIFPLQPNHHFIVLWGGWLIIGLLFFSIAGFFHAYYLVMLVPPLAVVIGSGLHTLWLMRKDAPQRTMVILIGGTVITLIFQWGIVHQFMAFANWLPLMILVFVIGLALFLDEIWHEQAYSLLIMAMVITPLIWSLSTVLYETDVNLPRAYSGDHAGILTTASNQIQINRDWLAYLQENTQNVQYLIAVPSAMQGASYVLATGQPVLYMGGFSGNDPVISSKGLSQMVAQNQLRYILLGNTSTRSNPYQQTIETWITTECIPIESANKIISSPNGFGREGSNTLYEC